MANGNKNLQSLLQTVRSNFPTFLLGLTVLLVIILIVSLFSGNKQKENKQAKSWTDSLVNLFTGKGKEEPQTEGPKTYTVKEGDHLWAIAEGAYGSGYNAYDIASINKLGNPDQIEVGQQLILPSVAPKTPTAGDAAMAMTEKTMPKPASYTVKEGDYLWQVALTYYGDGLAWVKIAEANKLPNPDVIQPGTKLSLP